MAGIALGLYLIYLLTAFGLRSWLQYLRTGSAGFRGVSGRPGSVEWWGGALFVATTPHELAGSCPESAAARARGPVRTRRLCP